MSEYSDQDALSEHRAMIEVMVAGVQDHVYPALCVSTFNDASRLIGRFEKIVQDWRGASATHSTSAIHDAFNELLVATELLKILGTPFELKYEPKVTPTGQSIDFLLCAGKERHYFDVKTVRPDMPSDPVAAWAKHKKRERLLASNTTLGLAEDLMGGEFSQQWFAARSKFLEYTRELEEKTAGAGLYDGDTARLVLCNDGIWWHRNHLEDFADFYLTGRFRDDDAWREMQAHAIKTQQINLRRNITGFCYFKRPRHVAQCECFRLDLRGPFPGR